MPKLIVDGFPVEVEADLLDDFRNHMKESHEVSEKAESNDKNLIYTANTYIEHVRDYLNKEPPDLKQAGEKIWGLVAHIIKKFFININVTVKSHRATKALALFLFSFHKDGINLTTFFDDAEWCYKNFYATCFSKNELEEILAKAQEFIDDVTNIPVENVKQVKQALVDHINGKTLNKSLKEVKFRTTCITEEFEGKNFTSTFIAT